MTDIWKEMLPSEHPLSYRTRRFDPQHPLDFFYGKDYSGRYIFIFKGVIDKSALSNPPKLSGIDISIVEIGDNACEMHFVLLDSSHVDIFRALCVNLMAATKSLNRGAARAGAEVVLNRLHRWQELLKFRRDGLLSKSQIIGLFGELLLLRDLFFASLSPLEAVVAWRGPYGDEQDFLLGEWMIEAKTQLSSSDRKLKISSAAQLDTSSGKILLCHQTVSGGCADTDSTFSLNFLVDEIILELGRANSSVAVDLFQAALVESGYVRRDEYDEFSWMLNGRTYFNITEGFPVITPVMIPDGIESVSYCINVEACADFVVGESQVSEWMFQL